MGGITASLRRGAALAGFLAVACAATPHVEIDSVESDVLAAGRSYAIDTDRLGAGEPAWGPSARATARRALEETLRERGFVPAEDPEAAALRVAVGVRGETRAEREPEPWPEERIRVERRRTGVRTPLGDVPLGERTRVVHEHDQRPGPPERAVHTRTVIVEVTDLASDRVVWQGTSRGAAHPERIDLGDLERRVRAIAARLPEVRLSP